jgi:membrane-associated phospholipid phosphatase
VLLDVVFTVFAIVVTANHWILDAVGGWAVLALSWALVTAWERWRHPAGVEAADSRT